METALTYARMAKRDIDRPGIQIETVKDYLAVVVEQLEEVSNKIKRQWAKTA